MHFILQANKMDCHDPLPQLLGTVIARLRSSHGKPEGLITAQACGIEDNPVTEVAVAIQALGRSFN